MLHQFSVLLSLFILMLIILFVITEVGWRFIFDIQQLQLFSGMILNQKVIELIYFFQSLKIFYSSLILKFGTSRSWNYASYIYSYIHGTIRNTNISTSQVYFMSVSCPFHVSFMSCVSWWHKLLQMISTELPLFLVLLKHLLDPHWLTINSNSPFLQDSCFPGLCN